MRYKFQSSRPSIAALALFSLASFAHAAPPAVDAESTESAAMLEQYFNASKASQESSRNVAMSVDMRGSIPRLSREGGMKATRKVAANGEVSYTDMTFDGDQSIKTEVIARFMRLDVEASKQAAIGITNANYKFKYWGIYGSGDWQLHLFELTPRRKAPGLFKGWLWVESKTGLPVREEGRMVKNPSVFLKRWDFSKDYDIRSGIARLSGVAGTLMIRVVGEVKATIRFDNYQPLTAPTAVASAP